ncbi:hypothetical protein PVAND_014276 [Polypedilum vanderplanki]|uniref:Uncharacterized protein n=1 Tax=Polypedilum vanderplanki TaxID=319348 RepID=A0A9J6CTL7_POLVA|nr:hypothetical protein PVAND_014276 [Polypedilum vanderplanki]
MRTKNFIFLLVLVILFSLLLIILGPSNNENIANIQNLANKHFSKFKENLRVEKEKELDIDPKYMRLLGFTLSNDDLSSTSTTKNSQFLNFTKQNFSIVSYVLQNQIQSTILQIENLANVMPSENFLIYDLGLSDVDFQTLSAFCNSSSIKCLIMKHDLSEFPSYIMDEKLHLFRPVLIKQALARYRTILFISNHVRFRNVSKTLNEIRRKTEDVTSLMIKKIPITSNTHPRMFDFFLSDADSFLFVRQAKLDAVFFHGSKFLDEKILLPWLKCILTPQCIQPIGANSNSNHCKFNKKPQYRYSGCHGFDESAFNVICSISFNFNEARYSITDTSGPLFYKESLEDSIRILDNRKRNISETSDHPYNSDE